LLINYPLRRVAKFLEMPCCARMSRNKMVLNNALCDMDREFCEHGLAERRRNAAATASGLLISPNGIAHFAGCPHKGDHDDYSRWAELNASRAWERLGNGEQLKATGGLNPGLTATDRCKDCVSHGPW
jgi:hypothetical protein